MVLKYRRAAVWAACFLFAGAACADTLWLQKDGERLKVLAGELHSPTAMPTLRDARPLLAGGQQAALDAAPDHYAFAAGAGDSRFTALRVGSDGVLTYFQARFGIPRILPDSGTLRRTLAH